MHSNYEGTKKTASTCTLRSCVGPGREKNAQVSEDFSVLQILRVRCSLQTSSFTASRKTCTGQLLYCCRLLFLSKEFNHYYFSNQAEALVSKPALRTCGAVIWSWSETNLASLFILADSSLARHDAGARAHRRGERRKRRACRTRATLPVHPPIELCAISLLSFQCVPQQNTTITK